MLLSVRLISLLLFFFNDPATTEIYTLSLHDALPILLLRAGCELDGRWFSNFNWVRTNQTPYNRSLRTDRKSTRLNSSHSQISYAVFCLKKKKIKKTETYK